MDIWVASTHPLALANNAAMNVGVQVTFQDLTLNSFRCIPRSGIAGSYGSSVFNFLRNFHTIFHNEYTTLHACRQRTRVPVSLHPYQHLFSVFLIIAILMGVG